MRIRLDISIARVPRGAGQGVQVFGRPKNINRIPIRWRTAPHDVPEAEMHLEMLDKDDDDLAGYIDDDNDNNDDVLIETKKWTDSDDECSEKDLLQHGKDYTKLLDSSSDSSLEIDRNPGRKGDLERNKSLADGDGDASPEFDEMLPGRDAELRHMIEEGDESGSGEATIQSVPQRLAFTYHYERSPKQLDVPRCGCGVPTPELAT